jgi:hypothetical protein
LRLYLAIRATLSATSFVDLRMIPAAALIIPAFCSLSLPNRRWLCSKTLSTAPVSDASPPAALQLTLSTAGIAENLPQNELVLNHRTRRS